MPHSPYAAALTVAAALAAVPVLAQPAGPGNPNPGAAVTSGGASEPAGIAAPSSGGTRGEGSAPNASAQMPAAAPAQPAAQGGAAPAPGTPPGVVATVNNPNLAVATVRLEGGVRLSKIIGARVLGADDKELGTINDLVMTNGDRVTVAVVSSGGFLGLGNKLVAFPFSQLKVQGDRIVIPGVTAETVSRMPNFVY